MTLPCLPSLLLAHCPLSAPGRRHVTGQNRYKLPSSWGRPTNGDRVPRSTVLAIFAKLGITSRPPASAHAGKFTSDDEQKKQTNRGVARDSSMDPCPAWVSTVAPPLPRQKCGGLSWYFGRPRYEARSVTWVCEACPSFKSDPLAAAAVAVELVRQPAPFRPRVFHLLPSSMLLETRQS